MKWFAEQFAKSNIISGALALAIWGAIIYLAIVQAEIPDVLYGGGLTVVAFFFGAKKGEAEGEARTLARLGYIEKEF